MFPPMLDLLSRRWGACRDPGIQSIAPPCPEMLLLFHTAGWLSGLVWDCYSLCVFIARGYSLACQLVMGSSSASCQLGPWGRQLRACKLAVLPGKSSCRDCVCWVSLPVRSVSHAGADACCQTPCFNAISCARWAPAPRPPARAGAAGRAAARARGSGSCTSRAWAAIFITGAAGCRASQPVGSRGLPSWCGDIRGGFYSCPAAQRRMRGRV